MLKWKSKNDLHKNLEGSFVIVYCPLYYKEYVIGTVYTINNNGNISYYVDDFTEPNCDCDSDDNFCSGNSESICLDSNYWLPLREFDNFIKENSIMNI